MDNQDKKAWCEKAMADEQEFARMLSRLGKHAIINPAKDHDIYAADLFVNGKISDLKKQTTPFFKAYELFWIEPRYAVTFNQKDLERYKRLYPEIDIYFWLDWQTLTFHNYKVSTMCGIWYGSLAEIENRCSNLHVYQQRVSDTQGNAKSSYVFDVRHLKCLFEVK